MIKTSAVLLLSFLTFSCSEWNRGKAESLEQKRDVLLNESSQYVPGYLSKDPVTLSQLRASVVANGKETKAFLTNLINKCYNSSDKYCIAEIYYDAKSSTEQKQKKTQTRSTQQQVNKGDLFSCKVTIHQAGGPVDTSEMRVRVKDNVETVGFLFPDDKQVISPKLDVIDPDSGERRGRAPDGSIIVSASYDGHAYAIQLFNTAPVSQFNGAIVTYTSKLEYSGTYDIYDCEKISLMDLVFKYD